MIVQTPKNKYEREIYENCKNIPKLSEGEKSIIYDLAVSLSNYIYFDWEDINIKNYVNNIKLSYNKYKNQPGINVVCACINNCFKQYRASVEGDMYNKKLVIKDVSISNLKSGGNENETSENSTSK